MLNKLISYSKQGTLIITVLKYFILRIDKILLAKNLSFDQYYRIQKKMGFPVQRLIFYCENGYMPNLREPKSFNEKCIYLKLFSRNPILPIISDKINVREYVSKKIGDDLLIPLLKVVDRAENIKFDDLPKEFVIKTNFSSGQNIIVRDKEKLNKKEIVNKINQWMKMKYKIQELIWYPQYMDRKILIEKLLIEENRQVPTDYKFYVFKGDIKFIKVMADRYAQIRVCHYDTDWNILPHRTKKGATEKRMEKPKNLDRMIKVASSLGEDFDFMRVDLYSFNDQIYFGELTCYPGNGLLQYDPPSFDFELGDCWEMDLSYITNKVRL